ncbi:hypothetical protein AKJ08_2201 [Vulgatibacter incomptus]|uniref:Uncharacterized protein n=1 Tax=Vulgatibacter incomptus TaxID=1391653 RepID=A0A0K1PFC0_9BACT|nr:hypothetical protein AKJ08_2201 [Vulgatibacter incomptus]
MKISVPQVRARYLQLALRAIAPFFCSAFGFACARALLFVCSPPARESS